MRMYGVTIDDIYHLEGAIQAIKALNKRVTARVVIDNVDDILGTYLEPVKRLATVCDVMVQIQDSYGEADMTDEQFQNKAALLFDHFKCASIFEVGNEVNGDWCSKSIAERVDWAYRRSPKPTALTLFYQPGMIDWYRAHPFKTDYVFLSCYFDNLDAYRNMKLYPCAPEIMEINPKAKIGIGEYGFENMPRAKELHKRLVISGVETAEVLAEEWVGGGFYWDFQRDMVPTKKPLFKTLKDSWK